MYKNWKWIGPILVVAILLVGCSGTTQTQETSSDPLKIILVTDPVTPVVGNNELILEIQDEKGQPLSGAQVEVSADHTDMSGMTMTGPASEQENGKYAIDADFSMSGNWKITVYVRKESVDFKKDFKLIIP
ncbi:MAG: hypothetical protein CVU39_07300 [Chloroflexi bacterium HGW-Chloroflexi-10]|nr:MAG: hypothetical protein CVU39_07300 [Chloroflexi bacterium HGW-Chloroflexi-10]